MFTSTSTVVFKTFACDDQAVEGESYLRADYSLSCNTVTHTWYKVYAGVMIVVRANPRVVVVAVVRPGVRCFLLMSSTLGWGAVYPPPPADPPPPGARCRACGQPRLFIEHMC